MDAQARFFAQAEEAFGPEIIGAMGDVKERMTAALLGEGGGEASMHAPPDIEEMSANSSAHTRLENPAYAKARLTARVDNWLALSSDEVACVAAECLQGDLSPLASVVRGADKLQLWVWCFICSLIIDTVN